MIYTNAYPYKGFCCPSMPSYNEMPNRSIITNVADYAVTDNSIVTSKYNILNFIPLNLLVQFSKLPNIYFLIIGIMQMVPSITNSGGFPVIFIPLIMVVTVSAIKDLFEDIKRKQSDRQINHSKTHVLRSGGFVETQWHNLHIGDIVKIRQNEQFPADVILLQSSEDTLNCFIETKNLDGQTNLKYKQVKYQVGKELRQFTGERVSQLFQMRRQFKYERPNPFIYSFTGSHQNIPLDNNNMILRGCSLRITKWVTGLVIYSGVDTKIMLNSNKTRQKKSRLQFKMGLIVIYIFVVQMILTLVSAFISVQYRLDRVKDGQYESYYSFMFVSWGSWILLFTNFVPISLIVTLQMVKYIQGINISNCFFQTNQPSEVRVQTSTLNQELGQIQHVFSDKTGTLTRNYMSFKYMVVGQNTYGYDQHRSNIPRDITNVDFHDQHFMNLVKTKTVEQKTDLFDILVCFSLCHSVIIQTDQNGVKKYNASSPDELAFINMAKYCSWQYQGINQNNELCVQTQTELIRYKILHTIEFDSDRKRMSVIMQRNDKIYVFCKGADNIMLDRLRSRETKTCKLVNQRVGEWSREGLRTLLFARREVNKRDYEKWAQMYATSLSNLQKEQKVKRQELKKKIERNLTMRQHNDRNSYHDGLNALTKLIISDETPSAELLQQTPQIILNRLLNDNFLLTQKQKQFIDKYFDVLSSQCTSSSHQIEEILEKEFELIGATAIEDKLQDNVKETIRSIRDAGVKVWMLTGDKKETAINIGLSCGLVEVDMAIVEWKGTVEETLRCRKDYGSRNCCLVASGQDLLTPADQHLLLELVNACSAVICCRVTPKQKQDMVWLMRKNKCTTLAIGDGANDVNMINTAHVGVGIKGVEGAQAALCSDYAISEFQILRQLMLYHGRQSYRKNSQLILYNFYKNLLLSLPQFWYGVFNNYSSATIYDPWVYQLYNVVFTSFPIIIYAIFDQQYSVKKSLNEPELYGVGLQNRLFDRKTILFWFIGAAVYALVMVVIVFVGQQVTYDQNGMVIDFMTSGMTVFATCVILANLRVFIISYTVSKGLILFIVSSIFFVLIVYLMAQSYLPYGQMRNIVYPQLHSITTWGVVIATVGLIYTFQMIVKRYQSLRQVQKQSRIQFVQKQIQLSLLHRNPNSSYQE